MLYLSAHLNILQYNIFLEKLLPLVLYCIYFVIIAILLKFQFYSPYYLSIYLYILPYPVTTIKTFKCVCYATTLNINNFV